MIAMKNLGEESKYIRAKERVAKLKKFYGKLGTYLIFMVFFAAINYYTNEFRNPWFLWVAGFWGLGVAIDAGKTFGAEMIFGRNWEERKIKELMNEDQNVNTRKKESDSKRRETDLKRKDSERNWWE